MSERLRRQIVPSLRCLAIASIFITAVASVADEPTAFFEREIRPVLIQRCQECHGPKEQSSGLRVDSREALLAGGDIGPAIILGDAAKSPLLRAVRHLDDLEMPPDESLSSRQITAFAKWIELGAPWTASDHIPPEASPHSGEGQRGEGQRGEGHWAFQGVGRPSTPQLVDDSWCRTPIDSFIRARQLEQGLTPAPQADRRTLLRRTSYTLTGLPPTAKEVQEYVSDTSPRAHARLVDRLLASPAYGEHWGRHWLDIARYSDTKGYVYAREERHWVHSWTYRDWVTQAWNENMPYDRFLLLQLAADQVADCRQSDLAAMGFLTLGRRFLGVNRDIIDDRIDVVCRGMLGLTVSCARCHDHKYDPIPTADYYSLYGVFDSCAEKLVSLDDEAGSEEFLAELRKRQRDLNEKLSADRDEASTRCRERVADYLRAQTELSKYPANGFDQIFEKTDLLPAFVRRWEAFLYEAKRGDDPVFSAWHAYKEIPQADFREQSERVTRLLQQTHSTRINAIVLARFKQAPKSFDEVIERYSQIFAGVLANGDKVTSKRSETDPPNSRLTPPDADEQQLRQVLFGPNSPCVVPDEPIVHTETYFDSATCTDLWKRQGEVDRWIINSETGGPFSLILTDRPTAARPRIFRRGDPLKKGRPVPRRFLSVLSDEIDGVFKNENGSGRLELARAIIDSGNPLTARVIVNRVWTHHFGQGLVLTPSDFGTRAPSPSHPELLDSLASRFMDEGWDLKKLHRWILLSATYRQSSSNETATAVDHEPKVEHALQVDPDNRLLWRANPQRLSFEEFRDSLLASTNQLDPEVGGKPTQLFDEPFPQRRTIYGTVDRQYFPGTLRMFDFANPDLHVAKRAETTVPQQALFLMNHPIVLQRAAALAKLARQHSSPQHSIHAMFQQALQRSPTPNELVEATELIESDGIQQPSRPPATQQDWKYGFGTLDMARQRVTPFTPLPHFTGTAWQGGSQWPDKKLGWIQLTATGGHPGNDLQHAAIRRWTAPREMAIEIRSRIVHSRPPGDGVRAFIVASQQGVLSKATVHNDEAELNVETIHVVAGETIDFVVDIGDILNSDEHLWESEIQSIDLAGETPTTWNSEADFPQQRIRQLDAWEQLAQVLLCTNEFTFID